MFYGGLTYSSHPVSLAAALATIAVYEEDGLIEQRGPARAGHARPPRPPRRPSTRASGAIRNLGLFGIIDLVRSHDPWTPLTPFNGTSDEMKAIGKFLRDNGLYTMIAEQLDPHQPAAVHHRGAAGRGLRDHRSGPRHRRPGGPSRLAGGDAGGDRSPRSPRAVAVGRGSNALGRHLRRLRRRGRSPSGRGSSPRRDPWRLPRRAAQERLRSVTPALPLGLRERPEPAAHLEHRRRAGAAVPARRGPSRSPSTCSARRCTRGARPPSASSLGTLHSGSLLATSSSIRGCSSAPSCRTSSPARPSRSSPWRR